MSSVVVSHSDKYCIVSAYSEDHNELVQKIQNMLNEGWALSGGLTASNSRLYQALKKL
jgi:hypothetical protein